MDFFFFNKKQVYIFIFLRPLYFKVVSIRFDYGNKSTRTRKPTEYYTGKYANYICIEERLLSFDNDINWPPQTDEEIIQ